MQELRLIGVHEDGSHVLLADEAGVRYRLPLDERLRAAARRASAAAHAAPGESSLTAREVQALIRAGHSAEEVAERAGWAVRKVAVFEAPVLAERGYVAGLARTRGCVPAPRPRTTSCSAPASNAGWPAAG